MSKSSPIDELFEKIFGFKPEKPGTAYEMLASAVMKIVSSQNTVLHDEKMRGKFSQSLYQIDVSVDQETGKSMGEAKDYTIQNEKVGRGDLQKLGGALNDLDVEKGIFFSATDYTKPAKQYAKASEQINNKGIDLFHLRPVVEQDKDGYILGVNLHGIISYLDFPRMFVQIIFTEESKENIRQEFNLKEGSQYKYKAHLENIFDKNGDKLTSLFDITTACNKYVKTEENFLEFCALTPGGFVPIDDKLRGIKGIEFKIAIKQIEQNFTVSIEDNLRLTLKDENGQIDRWITDIDLKKIRFLPNGEAIFNDEANLNE